MGNIDFITGRYSAKRSDAYHDASLRDHSRNARTPLLLGFVAKFSQSRVLGQSSREKYAYFGDVPEFFLQHSVRQVEGSLTAKCSIRPCVLIERRLVTDRHRNRVIGPYRASLQRSDVRYMLHESWFRRLQTTDLCRTE